MRIISRRTLKEFWESGPGYGDAQAPLEAWYCEAKKAKWKTPADIKEQYANVSIVANNRAVFNIHGNKYRLVVKMEYRIQRIYIRFVGTHEQYDRINAEKI